MYSLHIHARHKQIDGAVVETKNSQVIESPDCDNECNEASLSLVFGVSQCRIIIFKSSDLLQWLQKIFTYIL